jgi:hypothetical protein
MAQVIPCHLFLLLFLMHSSFGMELCDTQSSERGEPGEVPSEELYAGKNSYPLEKSIPFWLKLLHEKLAKLQVIEQEKRDIEREQLEVKKLKLRLKALELSLRIEEQAHSSKKKASTMPDLSGQIVQLQREIEQKCGSLSSTS